MFVPLTVADARAMPQSTPFILIPYRDNAAQERAEQLRRMTMHMKRYHPDWQIYVIEQSQDGKKFNRGALLNAGTLLAARQHATYVIYHDVDLIPLSKIVPYYTAFPEDPIHIGKAWTSKYDSPTFLGGILSISVKDAKQINGFPNQFWGWGGEDDALRVRLQAKQIPVLQPTLRGEGFTELSHVDSRSKAEWKNMQKWEDMAEERAHPGKDGLKQVKFKVIATEDLAPNVKKITVEL